LNVSGRRHGIVDGFGHDAAGNGRAVLSQDVLRLIFVELHERRADWVNRNFAVK
jgi:hypothetical protein